MGDFISEIFLGVNWPKLNWEMGKINPWGFEKYCWSKLLFNKAKLL